MYDSWVKDGYHSFQWKLLPKYISHRYFLASALCCSLQMLTNVSPTGLTCAHPLTIARKFFQSNWALQEKAVQPVILVRCKKQQEMSGLLKCIGFWILNFWVSSWYSQAILHCTCQRCSQAIFCKSKSKSDLKSLVFYGCNERSITCCMLSSLLRMLHSITWSVL